MCTYTSILVYTPYPLPGPGEISADATRGKTDEKEGKRERKRKKKRFRIKTNGKYSSLRVSEERKKVKRCIRSVFIHINISRERKISLLEIGGTGHAIQINK